MYVIPMVVIVTGRIVFSAQLISYIAIGKNWYFKKWNEVRLGFKSLNFIPITSKNRAMETLVLKQP